jgi:probable HAF family extracellular repeat protein
VGAATVSDRASREAGRGFRDRIAVGPLAYGINNRGQVVGAYRDEQFQIYGFLFDERGFTPIRPPGARGESFATDINDRGRTVGLDR